MEEYSAKYSVKYKKAVIVTRAKAATVLQSDVEAAFDITHQDAFVITTIQEDKDFLIGQEKVVGYAQHQLMKQHRRGRKIK